MKHLIESLDQGKDIGHWGRFTFVAVAHHFMSDEELIHCLEKNPNFDHNHALSLVKQVRDRNYNPPRRETIMHWQSQQEFPICPGIESDMSAGNVYRDLRFPDVVYEHIGQYHTHQ